MRETYFLGLTGGIASGKSTIAKLLKEKGIPVLDADVRAHELMEPGAANWTKIVAEFGPDFLNADQKINRKKLGQLVFNDKEALARLNKLSHPTIKASIISSMEDYREQEARVVVVDIPLLFEGKFAELFDAVLLVDVNEATQVERLMARDQIDEATAKQKIAAQMPLEKKRKLANYLIDNTGTIEETTRLFEAFFKETIVPLLEE